MWQQSDGGPRAGEVLEQDTDWELEGGVRRPAGTDGGQRHSVGDAETNAREDQTQPSRFPNTGAVKEIGVGGRKKCYF